MATRKVHFYASVAEFLEEYIFHNDACAIFLVVCSTRHHFLEKLFVAVQTPTRTDDSCKEHEHGNHKLLTNTIGLLAKSSRIKLVFCPTVESLRAYISGSRMIFPSEMTASIVQRDSRPVLAILDLLTLHNMTPEFSAQGLSRTLASLVEAAARETADLVLSECADVAYPVDGETGQALWYADVPLLRGPVQPGEGDDNTWRGPGVPVRRVVRRWFDFDENSRITTRSTNV